MAKKKANGEGSIRKRANGTWEARVSIGPGQSKSLYGKTKAEVYDKMIALQQQVALGSYMEETNMTVEEWLNIWINEWVINVKPKTKIRYECSIRNHLIPSIGFIKLKKLTPAQVQLMYKQRSQVLSGKSIYNLHGVLHSALKRAVKLGLISHNVVDQLDTPRFKRKEMRPLSRKELAAFLEVAKPSPHYNAFYVAAFTGLRVSELIGLTWDCIDFENGIIKIYRQYYSLDGVYQFAPLKNSKSRIIQPAKQVMDLLAELHKDAASPDDFVFHSVIGKHLTEEILRASYQRYLKKIGITDARFHDLRHTYATLALQSGVNIKTLSESLGHATVAFTLDMYGHVSDEMRQVASEKMGNLISSL